MINEPKAESNLNPEDKANTKNNQTSVVKKKNAFVFIPSFLVTQPIFQYLSKKNLNTYQLYCGCYGTGKSTSFILYHTLLTIINQYVYYFGSDKKERDIMESLQ